MKKVKREGMIEDVIIVTCFPSFFLLLLSYLSVKINLILYAPLDECNFKEEKKKNHVQFASFHTMLY
jgi:adenine C2-methylase RlmN of 23S rRNA A2503 and tRNA A37